MVRASDKVHSTQAIACMGSLFAAEGATGTLPGEALGHLRTSIEEASHTNATSLRPFNDGLQLAPVTRQITSPTSSATSKECPSGPIVTPTGRP